MFTIDTNILIYYAAGDIQVVEFLNKHLESDIFLLPTIAVAEFFSFPALRANEISLFDAIISQLEILPLDFETAKYAAKLKQRTGIKLADSVVAATAMMARSTLITRNIRDFKKIPNIKLLKI